MFPLCWEDGSAMVEEVFPFPAHGAAGEMCLSTPGAACAIPHPIYELLRGRCYLFPANLTSAPPDRCQEKPLNCFL